MKDLKFLLIVFYLVPFFILSQNEVDTSYNFNEDNKGSVYLKYNVEGKIRKYKETKLFDSLYMVSGINDSVLYINYVYVKKNDSTAVPDGPEFHYTNNKLSAYRNYKNGELNGLAYEFYENNSIKQIKMYKDGVINGKTISFFENGIIKWEGNIYIYPYLGGSSRSIKYGKWNYYNESGNLDSTGNYKIVKKKNAIDREECNCNTLEANPQILTSCFESIKDGIWIYYDKNGLQSEKVYYKEEEKIILEK